METQALQVRIDALVAAGWETDAMGEETPEVFEALIHELAHSVVMGDLTPKDMGSTAQMIRGMSRERADRDEVLTTAVTIQLCETFYHYKGCTNMALGNVQANVYGIEDAEMEVMETINTPEVIDLAKTVFTYIESLIK